MNVPVLRSTPMLKALDVGQVALLPLLRSEMESTRQHKTWSTRVFCICISKFYRRSGSAFEPDNASVGLNPTFLNYSQSHSTSSAPATAARLQGCKG